MPLHALDEQEVHYLVSRIKDLSVQPMALQQLLRILHEDSATPNDLESIIGFDQALTAKVLRVANSSYYGFRGKVQTVSRAIAIIGLTETRSICLCALLKDFLAIDKGLSASEREGFWKHSFITAKASALMAKSRPWIKKDHAYSLGLLHDLGKYAMALYLTEQYRAMMRIATQRKAPFRFVESGCSVRHELIGKWIAIRWALPEDFQRVIEFHHMPEKSPSYRVEATLVSLADILANSHEYPELLSDEITLSYCKSLLIVEEEWEEHQAALAGIRVEADLLWNILR